VSIWWSNDGTSNTNHTNSINLDLQTGIRYNFIYTYDGTTLIGYFDGQRKFTANASAMYKASTSPLYIGKRDTVTTAWSGYVDEFIVFSGALNSTDVQTLNVQM
jgi:hypothetical protein